MHRLNAPLLPGTGGRVDGRRFGMVSTFPPTECGIATFSAALCAGIIAAGGSVDVVRLGRRPSIEDASVLACIVGDRRAGHSAAIDVLNAADVAIVQHEYGIYAGSHGRSVVDIVRSLTVPTIVVPHTVLTDPSGGQRSVLARLCEVSDAVVVMTEIARERLIRIYGVASRKISVIPHGAATPSTATPRATAARGATPDDPPSDRRRARLLTWGLLGPGKGIEWAIDAVGMLGDLSPAPEYLIAGATHPKVVAEAGESYRRMLEDRASSIPAPSLVTFDASYRVLSALNTLIRSADVVVLPYDSKDQVTSGVLVDAVAAGRPVVSTAFPHAVELLSSGAGIVVPQRDPGALADAVRAVLTEPGRWSAMAAEARRLAPDLSWTSVAGRYATLAGDLLGDRRTARA